MKVNQVVESRCCTTCVHRKPYPPTMRTGQPVFFRFLCGLPVDAQKEIVRPEEVCEHWQGVTLVIE
ncbi:MAG: hypothetical protein PHN78_05575 [Dehalococcoidales bacterium]|nr:hypothetical protein [Dehalococcoidales bacterium]